MTGRGAADKMRPHQDTVLSTPPRSGYYQEGLWHATPAAAHALCSLLGYQLGLAEVQQAAGGAVWSKTGLRKSRDGLVNGTVGAWHK